jgi:hypothetical protein
MHACYFSPALCVLSPHLVVLFATDKIYMLFGEEVERLLGWIRQEEDTQKVGRQTNIFGGHPRKLRVIWTSAEIGLYVVDGFLGAGNKRNLGVWKG